MGETGSGAGENSMMLSQRDPRGRCHETSPPAIFASGSGCCRAPRPFADRVGGNLSVAAGALDRFFCGGRPQRHPPAPPPPKPLGNPLGAHSLSQPAPPPPPHPHAIPP